MAVLKFKQRYYSPLYMDPSSNCRPPPTTTLCDPPAIIPSSTKLIYVINGAKGAAPGVAVR
ncbi:hypothetical protein BDZ89DRAFT_1066289 [Hymenopellis radicata]|nr:hypothetical protein BDZ89DRAFT_1066289 [Hymenopellis radicata]